MVIPVLLRTIFRYIIYIDLPYFINILNINIYIILFLSLYIEISYFF